MFKKSFLTPLLLIFCCCALSSVVFSQGTTSRITGIVTDGSGAVVSGATVTLTNEGTRGVLTTETSANGTYTFDLLQVGVYQVSVEKSGFKRFVSRGNSININLPATVNVALEIGDVSAVVEVESSASQVQTSISGNIGTTVEQRTLESMPIVGTRGRNPLDLLNYMPGVVSGANTGGGVHVNGSRDRAFNFTLDGIDINEATSGGSNFTPLRPNPDSLQEFQVVTSGFSAELGRSSGAQVTLVTKSGTNEFKGNLFEYYQTPRFQARSYSSNVNNTAKEQFVQHIFGGSLGGPMPFPNFGSSGPMFLKDKAFFFVNLQMLRAYDSVNQTRTVYTQQARQGLFRWTPGRQNGAAGSATASVDANGNPLFAPCTGAVTTNCTNTYNIANNPTGVGLDPLLMSYLNRMPLPNNFAITGDGLNTAGFVFASPQRERQWDFVSKFDFKITDNNVFYVRYAQGEQNTIGDSANSGRPRFPGDDSYRVDTFRTPKNLAINWRSSPSSSFTNEFIFGYSQFGFGFTNANVDPNYSFVFNLPTDYTSNFNYNARSFRTLQFVDNLTFIKNSHTIKAGTNLRFGRGTDDRSSVAGSDVDGAINFSRTINNNFTGFNLPTGTAVINANDRTRLENMINDVLGRVGQYTQAFVSDPNNPSAYAPGGTRWINVADYPELDFYAQDNWKLASNFTVDFGLRWELKFAPRSATGRPILAPDQSITLGSPASNTLRWVERPLFDDDFTVFLPTAGFAWDPFKDGKTSIRANYRIASDRMGTQYFGSLIFQSAPGNTFLGSDAGAYGSSGGLLRNGLPPIVPTANPTQGQQPKAFDLTSINVIDPELRFPRIHSWTVSFQRELWKNNVIEVNYIGKMGRNLLGGYNANNVNINASVSGINETFLQAFNKIKGNANETSQLINYLVTGDRNNNRGTALFRSINSAGLNQGSAGTLALQLSQRLCQNADTLSNGTGAAFCTPAQASAGSRLLDVTGNSGVIQPFSQFTGGVFVTDSNDYSDYQSLEVIFRRNFSKGLSFQFGYTWGLSKDTRSFDPVFTSVATGTTQTSANTPADNNRDTIYAWSDFDRRHSFQGTYVYELPFGEGKWLGSNSPSVLRYIISGWQLSGGLRLTSGRPFTVYDGLFTTSNSVGSFANCSGCTRDMGKVFQDDPTGAGLLRNWFFNQQQIAMFSATAPGELGNTGRNFFIGPSFFQTDASLRKQFKITEKVNFDLRIETVNLTNTPNFNLPTTTLTSTIFGRINADVVNNSRRTQLVGRINF